MKYNELERNRDAWVTNFENHIEQLELKHQQEIELAQS